MSNVLAFKKSHSKTMIDDRHLGAVVALHSPDVRHGHETGFINSFRSVDPKRHECWQIYIHFSGPCFAIFLTF